VRTRRTRGGRPSAPKVSRENVQAVRHAFESSLRGDQAPLFALLDRDVAVVDHDLPDGGEYHGVEGFREWAATWDESWEEWRMEPQSFIDAGNRVVVLLKLLAVGRGSGVRVVRDDGMVWTLRDGGAVRVEYYGSGEGALEAVGLG